jgi:hypothetical protein
MNILTPIIERLNKELYEVNLRRSIYSLILKSKFKDDNFYYKHRPYTITLFYTYIIPLYYFNSTIILLFLLRKFKTRVKYSYIILLNLFSSICFSFGTEKLLFLEYSRSERPYSNIIISTHIKNKDKISDDSYLEYLYIRNKIKEKYSLIMDEYSTL